MSDRYSASDAIANGSFMTIFHNSMLGLLLALAAVAHAFTISVFTNQFGANE